MLNQTKGSSMRQRYLTVLLTGLLATYGSAANAVELPNGFYAGFGGGVSQNQDLCDDTPSRVGCDDRDFAWKILGGYKFMKWIGVEAAYVDLGDYELDSGAENGSLEIDGFTLAVTTTLPILERAGIFFKAGAFFWDTELTGLAGTGDDGTSLLLGGGLRLPFTERFGMGIEFDYLSDVGENNTTFGESDIFVYGANFIWSF
jgi:hypothetical protein